MIGAAKGAVESAKRYNAVTVLWYDENDVQRKRTAQVEDRESIIREGYWPMGDVTLAGCSTREQAYRVGRLLLTQYEQINLL